MQTPQTQTQPVKRRWPRAEAIAVARELCQVMQPVCTRLVVAGSLRRRKQDVGDVEILFVPLIQKRLVDLLEADVNLAERAIANLLKEGKLTKRPSIAGWTSWGPQNKLAVHAASGIGVDLFATTEECWFNYLVCRTGSQESNERIASTAQRRGWKWNPTGVGFTKLENGEIFRVKSEEDVFRFVGLPYLKPEGR